jgi:hypothetical protein
MFDMSGGRKQAKLAGGRPLDGVVTYRSTTPRKSALMRRREGDSQDKMNMARNDSRHFLRRWTGEIGFFTASM